MGKGDKKTRRGKIILGTFGARRRRKQAYAKEAELSVAKSIKEDKEKRSVKEKAEVKEVKTAAEAKEVKTVKEKPAAKTPKPVKAESPSESKPKKEKKS